MLSGYSPKFGGVRFGGGDEGQPASMACDVPQTIPKRHEIAEPLLPPVRQWECADRRSVRGGFPKPVTPTFFGGNQNGTAITTG